MSKSNRVTLLVDDAVTALVALGRSIERLDETIIYEPERTHLVPYRDEKWAAYQRIAKALGVPADALRKQPSGGAQR